MKARSTPDMKKNESTEKNPLVNASVVRSGTRASTSTGFTTNLYFYLFYDFVHVEAEGSRN